MGELKQRGRIWWIRYYQSSGSDKYEKARALLKEREADVAKGVPFSPAIGRLRFDEAMADLETEYSVNKRDSLDHLKRRIKLHLMPWFGGRPMGKLTSADINAYVLHRQGGAGARQGRAQGEKHHHAVRVHPGATGGPSRAFTRHGGRSASRPGFHLYDDEDGRRRVLNWREEAA